MQEIRENERDGVCIPQARFVTFTNRIVGVKASRFDITSIGGQESGMEVSILLRMPSLKGRLPRSSLIAQSPSKQARD